MKKRFTFLIAVIAAILMIVQPGKAEGQTTVTWPGSTALPSSATSVAGDANITIKTSSTNSYTSPIRIYANTTVTIAAKNNTKITSIAYEASSTGTYVTEAQNATVSPSVTPTVSGKIVTWSYDASDNVTEFTFKPSAQTRSNGISITYVTATNYTVTISNTIANGSVTASPTSAVQNATIELTPSANSGYKLTGWDIKKTSDNSASGITPTGPNAQGKYTFPMPAYNVTVGATFSQTYAVTCATGLANGSISAEPATAAAGETITVTANPSENYKLKTVTVTETGGSNTVTPTMGVNSATFPMPAYPVTVSATFVRVYHVTYDANTTDYTGTTTDANVYESGASATVQANGFSKDGYTFSTWNTQANGQGTDYAPSSTYTIGTADVTLYAQWNIAQYNVAVSSVTGATVSAAYGNNTIAADANANVDCGTVIQLRADGLASGKAIVWNVYKTDDATTKVTVTNNSFTLPAYNVTISGSVGHIFIKYTGDISEGDYVFYSDGAAMSNSISSSRFVNQTTNISVNGNEMVVTTDATAADVTWYIANITQTSYWTLYNADEKKYGGSTSTKNTAALLESITDYAKWTVEEDENTAGAYDFINYGRSNASDTPANKYLRKNGNNGWACYSTGQASKPNIYKKSVSYQVDVTVADHGLVTASTSGQSPIAEGANANIRSGATVTLTVTPDANYTVQSLTVYKTGTPATTVTVTNNQFTMPDYAVTVEVVFRSTATVTLTYSVNGVESSSSVSEGDITLKTSSEITVPTDYTFAGWSTSPSDFSTLYNGSYSLVGNTTLYAVFSANKPALFSFEITKADFSTGGYSTDNDRVRTTTATSNDGKTFDVNWRSNQVYQNNSAMQWQADNGYIYNTTDLGTVKSITVTVKDSQGSFTTNYGTTQEPSSGTAGEGKGYFKTEVGSVYGLTSSVVVTFEKSVPFYFTRVIGTETATGDITINGPTIIENGKTLNMGDNTLECDDPVLFVIEDGGQLITTSENVQATVKSHILAATAKDVSNWYLISSPVKNPTLSTATNLLEGTYDFFRYNEAEGKWENQKTANGGTGFTGMTTGRGYLYRNSAAMDITYRGEVNVAASQAVTISGSGDLQGFNLIGNPYTHDIYKGAGTAIPNSKTDDYALGTGFYTLKSDGTWDTGTDNTTAIKPGQGLLVKASKAGTIVIGNTNAKAAKSNNDNIMFKVENSEYTDVAYAWFDKGVGLDKINHRNAEAPMLYINQDGVNYGIATMSDDTKSFNLNFKAMTMGKYTLSYKAKGNFSYLHVIDRLTGNDVDMLLEGEYSFIAAPGDNENRFIVVLEYLEALETLDGTFAYQNGNDIIVNGEGNLQIFDVMGRLIATQRINGVETVNVSTTGVYIFKLNEKTQKIVVR